jgi:hypothetical protein
MTKHIVRFEREKETRNTIRYHELPETTDGPSVVGTLYVSKVALELLGNPKSLKVTIESDK